MLNCPALQPFCFVYNDWLQAATYFWVEQLVTTSSVQEWTSKVTIEATDTTPGSWAERVEMSKAIRCYAHEHGAKVLDIKEEQVVNSELGVKGYAKLYESRPGAAPRPGGDGGGTKPSKRPAPAPEAVQSSNPGPAAGNPPPENPTDEFAVDPKNNNPKKAKKDGTAAKKEKEVKELLALEQTSDNCMTLITGSMAKEPEWWKWAADIVQSYKESRKDVIKLYSENSFYQSMKVAALSPKEMAALKKKFKDDYVTQLVQFVTQLGPKIEAMQRCSHQIEQMASAKRAAADSATLNRNSAKPKSKAKASAAKRKVIKKSPSTLEAGS